MESLSVGILIGVVSAAATVLGLFWKRDATYVSGLEQRAHNCEERVDGLEADVQRLKEEVRHLLNANFRLERQVSDLHAELREKDQEIRRLGDQKP